MNEIEKTILKISNAFDEVMIDVSSEDEVQIQIEELLTGLNISFKREKKLSNKDRIDFFLTELNIGVEIKIKGSATSILRQCERYCKRGEIKALLLISSKFMGFPKELNKRPCYFIGLSKGLL